MKKKMKKIKEIETRWQNHLMVLCAFRYCLGKQAYIASECIQWLSEWWDDLAQLTRKRIVEEATEAVENNTAGDICDRETWRCFISYVTKKATPTGAASTYKHTNENKVTLL